jgi:protein-tyrosine-phosphatase
MQPARGSSEFRIWGLAFGYFAFYVPYSGLTKVITQGSLPGANGQPVTGYTILPATVLGTTGLLLVLITAGRGWGRIGRMKVSGLGLSVPSVRWQTFLSGVATAVIIGTTTLNYTFAGISILLALLLMRGGVLVIAPVVDLSTGRRVSAFSWVAMALSLAAVALALSNVASYQMTLVAALNIAAYLGGYVIRLNVMSRLAKDSDPDVNRRYFFEETYIAAIALCVMPVLAAVLAPGTIGDELRTGFTGLFTSPLSGPALLIGLLYGALYIFGTWVYLDPKENTFCIPLNRCSSLLSGVVSSFALALLFNGRLPGATELAGVAVVATALGILMLETLFRQQGVRPSPAQRVFLFVCGGNTSRSPMAQAICNAEIARRLGLAFDGVAGGPVLALSAGLTAVPGRPLTEPSVAALRQLGVTPHAHVSGQVTAELVRRAEVIFCMSESLRQTLVERFPDASAKARRLDPDRDIDDPSGRDQDTYHAIARQLSALVHTSLPALGV